MDRFSDTTFTPDTVVLLDTEDSEERNGRVMDGLGVKVVGRRRWDGIIPEGSYTFINPFMRMSTPEFLFFRRCQELSHEDAIELACTLLSHYNTQETTPSLEEGEFERIDDPHTTFDRVHDYLHRIHPCEEKDRALCVLYDAIPYVDGYERACEAFCR